MCIRDSSEVVPYGGALEEIKAKRPKGIIFTGGPASVYEEGAPTVDREVFGLGIPVLGICYGAQLMALSLIHISRGDQSLLSLPIQ